MCQNSVNIYITFVAYSSNMTSEMTQFTVFSRLFQKKLYFSFVFKLGSVVRLCKQDLYFYQQCIFVSYINSRNMNLVCDVALYFRKEYAPFLTIFNSDWKVIDFLRHISESCTYFKKCHISRYIAHSILQNYSNDSPKISW